MFGARPTFGGTSTFGSAFGTNTPSSTFGATTFGRPAFGTPATTSNALFGTNTTVGNTLFGQNQTSGGGMFGSNTQSSGFNTGATTSTFGTSGGTMFGSNNQTTGTGLFGASGTPFNSSQNATRPFSFNTPASTSTTGGGLFGSTANTSGSALFNSSIGGQTTGTTVKFNPVTSTDTMNRGGVSSSIQTKIEVITAMKEYENKSLEELRVEDYLAGRKGASTQATGAFGFGANKFGTTATSTPLFGQTSSASTNLFGTKPTENKGAFGTNTGGFSFNRPSSAPPFGMVQTTTQAAPAFGSTGFSFGNTPTATTPFGDNKLGGFGTAASTANTGFFAAAAKPTFGMPGTSQSSNVFGKSTTGFTGGFGAATPSAFGTTNTTAATGGLFPQNQAKPGFSFGASTASGFGTGTTGFGTTGGGLFGQSQTQNKPGTLGGFGSGLSFGAPATSTGGFGFNQNPGSGGLLSSNTGAGFFGGQQSAGSLTTPGTGFGTNTGFGINTLNQGCQLNANNVVSNNNLNNLIQALTHHPFGNSSLLKSAAAPTGKADELLSTISNDDGPPGRAKNITTKKPNYILPSSITIANIAKPIGINRLSNTKADPAMNMLFAGLDDSVDISSDDPFKPKFFPRVKKLGLKVFKNIRNNHSNDSSLLHEVSVVASPITTPIGSPVVLNTSLKGIDTPTGRPFNASNENTPTPDIIKGRNNIKHLNIARKMPFNDSLAEYNMPSTQRSLDGDTALDENKENASLSIDISGYDQIPALNESAIFQHPAGIKLTRSGYYTLPSLDDLKDMIDAEGKCLVENFTVGRYDYGNICFLGVTDISNLDIDAIVHIVRKEVEVYPDVMDKPTCGEGLNKPALVTLDCVWPIDKASREVIRSEQRLVEMKWTEYLESQCLKMDASFVEYRPETGSWVFKVKHFSKYGLEDEKQEGTTTTGLQKTSGEKQINIDKIPQSTSAHLSLTSTMVTQLDVTPVSKKSNGPPALGLVSPPGLNFSRPSEDMVFTPPTRKVLLDDASIRMDEGIANEPDEGACLCPLSPSAERLTLASKISQKALQNKKSHLFYDDEFEEDRGEKSDRGEKRPILQSFDTAVVLDSGHQSSFACSAKKLMLATTKMAQNTTWELDDTSIRERIFSKSNVTIMPEVLSADIAQEVAIIGKPEMEDNGKRDPRTEYPLVPCGPDPNQSARHVTKHLQDKIEQERSVAANLHSCIADAATFMGRGFRVGWGPRLTLVHVGSALHNNTNANTRQRDQTSPSKVHSAKSFLFNGSTTQARVTEVKTKEPFPLSIERVHLVEGANHIPNLNENEISPILKTYMELVLDHSIVQNDDDFPQFAPESGIDLLHSLARPMADDESNSRLASVFHLCVALWGKLQFCSTDLDEWTVYAESQYRKEALSQWLENDSADVISSEVKRGLESSEKDGYLDAVFSHMSVRQVSEACSIAQKHGDHHLALLLAQVCLGEETPRQIMRQQLESWADSEADSYFSLSRMSLYSLIAGLPTFVGSEDRINTCLGLDWKRSLGLHYWYFSPATSTIGEGLELYEKASCLCESREDKYCEEPRPPYEFECIQGLKVNYDICYHLVKLFVDPTHKLETLLENSTITSDSMDFSGSWLLWCVLHSLGFTRLRETKANVLHVSFASILESQGHWDWAAFVLMFIRDKYFREKELEALLGRQLLIESQTENAAYLEKEQFLVEKLKLPVRRLQRLKAFRARYLKLTDEEAWYLLLDHDFNKAHKLILDGIAPKAVINEDHSYLKCFLHQLRRAQDEIIDWTSGGAIYCAYIEIIEQIDQLKATGKFSGKEIEKFRPKLLSLCSKLNKIKCPTSVHRVAVSEMSRVAVSVLRAILGMDPDAPRVLAQQVASLPLTHECALEELNHITHQYLMGSVMEF